MRFIVSRTSISYGPVQDRSKAQPPCTGVEEHIVTNQHGEECVYYTIDIPDLDGLMAFLMATKDSDGRGTAEVVITEPESNPGPYGSSGITIDPALPWLEIYDDYRE